MKILFYYFLNQEKKFCILEESGRHQPRTLIPDLTVAIRTSFQKELRLSAIRQKGYYLILQNTLAYGCLLLESLAGKNIKQNKTNKQKNNTNTQTAILKHWHSAVCIYVQIKSPGAKRVSQQDNNFYCVCCKLAPYFYSKCGGGNGNIDFLKTHFTKKMEPKLKKEYGAR